ncbi:MAG TPA: hypothetical protein PLO62_03055 [Candidatus Hydrogenedentes bacterium]|nr:hypothetical protein [Candidatus Hydrogenedentota bacterium]
MRRLLLLFMMLAPFVAMAEEMVANPGFEDIIGDMPARWHIFVQPMEGAHGALDAKVAHEGRCSIRLHNPRRYEKEPANNWSQNIMRGLGGRVLVVKGFIRTQTATEASIWLQCCKKKPWTVLSLSSTDDATPIYGTRDWAPVEMRVETPANTECLVVRCVLKGQGTAWFDDISVEDAGPAHESAPPTTSEPPSVAAAASDGSLSKPAQPKVEPLIPAAPMPPKQPELPAVPEVSDATVSWTKPTSPLVPTPKKKPETSSDPLGDPAIDRDTSAWSKDSEWRRAYKAVESANTALRRKNEDLERQVAELRKQLQAVQSDVRKLQDRHAAEATLDPPSNARPTPFLAPQDDPLLTPHADPEERP